MDEIVGFTELRWLREISVTTRKHAVPELVGARLLKRGLIERTLGGFTITARGRIALIKLG
ncbi:MAG: hypothetical protein ACREUB_03400 [Burkholderiales bacterium]